MLTRPSLENAVRVCLALGGSTNAALHLPAIARCAGVELTLQDFDQLSRVTPLTARFKPASDYTVVDLDRAGGIPAVLRILLPLLHGEVPSVGGRTLASIAASAPITADSLAVLRPLDAPLMPEGGIAVLTGNLAPRGAVVKQSAVHPNMLGTPARPAYLNAKRTCETRSWRETSDRVMCWLSATRGRQAGRECVNCRSRQHCWLGWGWVSRWR
jgi:dihydroxy-acid dehydratase